MAEPLTVSIVTPFYNEGPGVEAYFQALGEALAPLSHYAFEFVCVDDGSADDTLPRLLACAQLDPRIVVVELSRNYGKEIALTAGLDNATGKAVIPIDADLQDPPKLIASMLQCWEQGAEVVLARRIDREADSFLKRTTARLFYRTHNRLSRTKIPENVGDFRLMDRVVVDALKLFPERNRFMKGIFAWAGFKTTTVDYAREPRTSGTTKFSGWQLWNLALEGLTSFGSAPLKVWSYIGAVGATLTSLYAVYIVLRTLIYGVDVPGYSSILVAILFFGSLQLISIGVLGEYIGRIYIETKCRPLYLVRRLHGKPS